MKYPCTSPLYAAQLQRRIPDGAVSNKHKAVKALQHRCQQSSKTMAPADPRVPQFIHNSMKQSTFFRSALLAAVAIANAVAYEDHSYRAPGPNDLRSPCPGLNTLANHGFLPRDGRNITIPMIIQAGLDGYNIESHALVPAAKVGLLTSDDLITMTLDDVKAHGIIEHDASLSRQDFALGDNLHFNETIFTTLANSNPGSDVYNTTSAGQVQHDRLADSLATNPNVTNTETTLTIRSFESALYLSVMGDPTVGVAPKNFVQVFFREQRLPIEEGWKRSSTQITLDSLVSLARIITEESHWNATETCDFGLLRVSLN
ncbi:hypothetical protein VNI00_003592 [Paramarasmius palmivorus]|uniref:Heme haloperoxidase family profile domain-containing protein n=1 Tax=Paramarasmius palmivorus TaxID=297713 RepID=A0AAW0DVB2_9AGAR